MKCLNLSAAIVSSVFFAACVPELPATTPITTWYEDADGDLFGDPNSSFTGDKPSSFWVVDNTDCDDVNAAINPDSVELNTDQVDSDCDGVLSTPPYSVGDYGPAGGIVFLTDGMNGLEAAPEDQNGGYGVQWGCSSDDIRGADSLSDGAQNSVHILAAHCEAKTPGLSLAIDLVDAYSLNGYEDWFLPSQDELNVLYTEKNVVGGFVNDGYYWSSSEISASQVWGQYFNTGYQGSYSKNGENRVRSIRYL